MCRSARLRQKAWRQRYDVGRSIVDQITLLPAGAVVGMTFLVVALTYKLLDISKMGGRNSNVFPVAEKESKSALSKSVT